MCMCGKPVINGEMGFVWNGEAPHIYPVNPPEIQEGETILYDEPGRCGGLDSHSHHYRVVQSHGSLALLVRHGGGDERISYLSCSKTLLAPLAALDSNGRYWVLNAMYQAQRNAASRATDDERARWRKAAAEKRIKTRKVRDGVKVWMETRESNLESSYE